MAAGVLHRVRVAVSPRREHRVQGLPSAGRRRGGPPCASAKRAPRAAPHPRLRGRAGSGRREGAPPSSGRRPSLWARWWRVARGPCAPRDRRQRVRLAAPAPDAGHALRRGVALPARMLVTSRGSRPGADRPGLGTWEARSHTDPSRRRAASCQDPHHQRCCGGKCCRRPAASWVRPRPDQALSLLGISRLWDWRPCGRASGHSCSPPRRDQRRELEVRRRCRRR
eukprot:scaffold2727_cov385-Prasinococcus_capsulatus_cf.AAC.17